MYTHTLKSFFKEHVLKLFGSWLSSSQQYLLTPRTMTEVLRDKIHIPYPRRLNLGEDKIRWVKIPNSESIGSSRKADISLEGRKGKGCEDWVESLGCVSSGGYWRLPRSDNRSRPQTAHQHAGLPRWKSTATGVTFLLIRLIPKYSGGSGMLI